jgi:hypothetical protein
MAAYLQWNLAHLAGWARETFMNARDKLPDSCFGTGEQQPVGEGSNIRKYPRGGASRLSGDDDGTGAEGDEENGGDGPDKLNGRLSSFEIAEGGDDVHGFGRGEKITEWQAGWNVTNAIQVSSQESKIKFRNIIAYICSSAGNVCGIFAICRSPWRLLGFDCSYGRGSYLLLHWKNPS